MRLAYGVAVMVLLGASGPGAQSRPPDSYDDAYQRYLASARVATPSTASSFGWMASLAADRRARSVNDLVTVRVVESISASGSADSALTKNGKASAAVPSYFGSEKKAPSWLDPTNLASVGTGTTFSGAGTTTRSGELSAIMTARVVEVLPNGDLVLEGIREIEINGDRQIVVLSGVARQPDIRPDNTLLSTQVGQLRIRYFGRGLMKDNLKPGWLIRILNKIF
jgi:flagellar L-ring protein FlgH